MLPVVQFKRIFLQRPKNNLVNTATATLWRGGLLVFTDFLSSQFFGFQAISEKINHAASHFHLAKILHMDPAR